MCPRLGIASAIMVNECHAAWNPALFQGKKVKAQDFKKDAAPLRVRLEH